MDCTCRTLKIALPTGFALGVVDIGNIILNGDSIELAHLGTLATADAGSSASLACHAALVLIDAADIYPSVILKGSTHVAKLYDAFRTGFGTCSTSGTLGLIHHRQPS